MPLSSSIKTQLEGDRILHVQLKGDRILPVIDAQICDITTQMALATGHVETPLSLSDHALISKQCSLLGIDDVPISAMMVYDSNNSTINHGIACMIVCKYKWSMSEAPTTKQMRFTSIAPPTTSIVPSSRMWLSNPPSRSLTLAWATATFVHFFGYIQMLSVDHCI